MPYKNKADRDRHNKKAYVKYKAAGYYQTAKYQAYQNEYKRSVYRRHKRSVYRRREKLDGINALEGMGLEKTKIEHLRETATPDSVLGEFFAKNNLKNFKEAT
jgi:hypothetical protein